jgi:Hemerythrin HHE cation binding domain
MAPSTLSPSSSKDNTNKIEFDPTDPKYQVSDDFLPNKASTWTTPIEDDGWVHAHNALRMELTKLVEAVQTLVERHDNDDNNNNKKLEEWEIINLKTAWKTHCVHTHAHHENEDDLLVPFVKTRFYYPTKCETDHDGLITDLDALTIMINEGLRINEDETSNDSGTEEDEGKNTHSDDKDVPQNTSSKSPLQRLLNKLKSYQESMLAHLKEEEDTCLPLTRAYFTHDEIASKIQQIIGKGPKVRTGKKQMGLFSSSFLADPLFLQI